METNVKWVNTLDDTLDNTLDDTLDNTSVILTKSDGKTITEKIILSVGNVITYDGTNPRPDGVKIISFTTTKDLKSNQNVGPIGMRYLPWRKKEKLWAEPAYVGMRGDPRHIICYPVGKNSYGEHIDWGTVKLITNPEIN